MEALALKSFYMTLCLILSVLSSISAFAFDEIYGPFYEMEKFVNETDRMPELSLLQQMRTGIMEVKISNGIVSLIITKHDGTLITNTLQMNLGNYKLSAVPIYCGTNKICLMNNRLMHTIISTEPDSETISVYRKINEDSKIIDCFDFENEKWVLNNPAQNSYTQDMPYLPTHFANMAIAERYWLSRKGYYIIAHETSPLFVDFNNFKEGHLCLVAKNGDPYRKREEVTLHYKIGVFDDPKSAHLDAVNNCLGKPSDLPDERMVQHPIWSTKNILNISDNLVASFADEILLNGYNNGQLEIDDKWEICYGSMTFDKKNFPNAKKMLATLKEKGFGVTLWIHPFVNKRCEPAYSDAYNHKYLVHSVNGRLRTSWWRGTEAGIIDFTNPKARQWWLRRLQNLQSLGFDGFKFDAGETSWLPQVPALNNGDFASQPGIFTQSYVKAVAEMFGNRIEVRTGWGTQNLPVFVRMLDKDSTWTSDNGLPAVVTNLLQMNLNGYIFVLPDVVGGNGNEKNSATWPSKNLFIRWIQANAFMPSVQFSHVPWKYDEMTNEIIKKYTTLHANMTSVIIESMNNSIKTGVPLNAPIWWIDPLNLEAYDITDEFMLGENILIAPVMEKDALKRDIYLPSGRWEDANNNASYIGPTWLRSYPSPLDVLPYFYKVI